MTDIIIGQEAICPKGLGRVIDYCDSMPHRWIQVETYVNDVSSKYDKDNVELIDPKGKSND